VNLGNICILYLTWRISASCVDPLTESNTVRCLKRKISLKKSCELEEFWHPVLIFLFFTNNRIHSQRCLKETYPKECIALEEFLHPFI